MSREREVRRKWIVLCIWEKWGQKQRKGPWVKSKASRCWTFRTCQIVNYTSLNITKVPEKNHSWPHIPGWWKVRTRRQTKKGRQKMSIDLGHQTVVINRIDIFLFFSFSQSPLMINEYATCFFNWLYDI